MSLPPSREEVEEMERLRRILNGESVAPSAKSNVANPNNSNIDPQEQIQLPGPGMVTDADKQAMAKILENFRSASDGGPVKDLVEKSNRNKVLREALSTEKTDGGVKIGSWVISKVVVEGLTGNDEIRYRIKNDDTGKIIKASFIVLEAARAIVSLLNNGATLNDPTVKKIAKLEVEYRRLRENALQEKLSWKKANKGKDEFKKDLYEARFDAAKTKALYKKEQIKNILYNL